MASRAYQSQKVTLKFSKNQVDKAGRAIRKGCSDSERKDAILKIQNYRETHLYPLMLIKNHLVKAVKKVSKAGLVARRLKMLSTIIDKLERPSLDGKKENAISLLRMQDIGGCRAIVSNFKQLQELHQKLKNSRSVHKIVKVDDYLTPKDSGYSGIHLTYSCFAGTEEDHEWKKTKIEVQLRTELQHAWATSLEIIDTLENIKLKTSSVGHPEWRRFFRIAGMLVAHDEKFCMLLPEEIAPLQEELRSLERGLSVRRKLSGYNLAIKVSTDKKNLPKRALAHQGMFLVLLKKNDVDKPDDPSFLVTLNAYSQREVDQAFSDLALSEENSDVVISVLVSAGDVRNLKKAYPNYFGSSRKFHNFLCKHIGGIELQ